MTSKFKLLTTASHLPDALYIGGEDVLRAAMWEQPFLPNQPIVVCKDVEGMPLRNVVSQSLVRFKFSLANTTHSDNVPPIEDFNIIISMCNP